MQTLNIGSGGDRDLNDEAKNGHSTGSVIDKAKRYGTSKGGTGRLLTVGEARNINNGSNLTLKNILYGRNYASGQTINNYLWYWLSNTGGVESGKYPDCIINGSITGGYYDYPWNAAGYMGVRPVVEVSKALLVPNEITITYNANGGTGEMTPTTASTAPKVAENAFTVPEGKGFAGWNTKADGTGTYYDEGDVANENIVLYAQWGLPLGTEITLGGENFFLIGYEKNNVKLLSKYCLSLSGNVQFGKSATYSDYSHDFSSTNYWKNDFTGDPFELQGIYLANHPIPSSETTANNAIKKAQAYGSAKASTTGKTVTGRLMTYAEANKILNSSNDTMIRILSGMWKDDTKPSNGYLMYWIGAAYSSDGPYYITLNPNGVKLAYTNYSSWHIGVRPVILIPRSQFE